MKNFLLCCFCCAATVCGAQAQDEHIVIWDNESAPTSSGLFGPTFIEKGVYEANNNVAAVRVNLPLRSNLLCRAMPGIRLMNKRKTA